MKLSRLLPFAALTVLATGCIQPERMRLAQQASLEDTIRFTQLAVAGNLVTLKISRVDPKLPVTRAANADPVEFPEYATFQITAKGLVSIASQTHLYIPISDAKCEDSACQSVTFTMKRPGGTLADSASLRAKILTNVNCDISIRETNGADTSISPVFSTATLTSIVAGQSDERYAIYGKSSYTLPNGYHANVFLRNFSGVPSELWIDEYDTSLNSSGQSVPVNSFARTFDADAMTPPSSSALTLTASDDAGRRAQVRCTY